MRTDVRVGFTSTTHIHFTQATKYPFIKAYWSIVLLEVQTRAR